MHLEQVISTYHPTQPYFDSSGCISSPINSPLIINDPVPSPPPALESPPLTSKANHVFQFPPPTHLTQDMPMIKQEDFGGFADIDSTYTNTVTDSNLLTFPNQCSPMAISPASLNTPRGSIVSVRSRQASPMIMDPATVTSTTDNEFSASFTIQIPNQVPPTTSTNDDLLPHYDETFDFAQYTIPSLMESGGGNPSPPCSGYSSPQVYNHQQYEDWPKQEPIIQDPLMGATDIFNSVIPKPDPDACFMMPSPATSTSSHGMMGRTNVERLSTDTCPETPDSSVKEDPGDVNSPDTGSYACLWSDCNDEFYSQKNLVEHVNDTHMETRKGCEEFPCLWKVRKKPPCYWVPSKKSFFVFVFQDCCRNLKAFNAKYKLITHMRVHTKEKPYLCTVRLQNT